MQLHDILLLRTSAILPEAISAGGLTPTTDTSLFLTTYRGGSHLPADIYADNQFMKDYLEQQNTFDEGAFIVADGAYSGEENSQIAALWSVFGSMRRSTSTGMHSGRQDGISRKHLMKMASLSHTINWMSTSILAKKQIIEYNNRL